MMVLSLKVLLAILPFFLHVNGQASGTGTTTRYWDCCKPSCSWPGKTTLAAGSNPVGICDANDNLLADYNTKSACDGGSAYMCGNESPWAVSDTLSYGYAAVNIAGGTEASWCCACYELTFTSGPVAGKKMVVQATNTGGDLGANHFDLAVSSHSSYPYNNVPMLTLLLNQDAWRRLRHFQRLQPRIRHPFHWLGRPVWWHFFSLPMRYISRSPQSWLLLALRLVPRRRQPSYDIPTSHVPSCSHCKNRVRPRRR